MTIMTRATVLLAATALGATACTAPADPAESSGPVVAVSVYPVEWVAAQVLGEHGHVEALAAPGADAHSVELSPRQFADLEAADVVVQLEGFQPAVDEAIAQTGTDHVLQIGDVVELEPANEAHPHDDHAEEEDHEGEDAHPEEEGHDDDHGDFDPHFWQDPTRMAALVTALADRLSTEHPELADDFQANANETIATLEELDAEFANGLGTCVRREFITTHAAFHYLAERYDLVEIGISGINPDAEPSPARIAEVHDEAQRHGVTTIFFETLTSDAVAESIASDLNLVTAVLDPLEGVAENSPGEDYPSIMRANLEALRTANDCR